MHKLNQRSTAMHVSLHAKVMLFSYLDRRCQDLESFHQAQKTSLSLGDKHGSFRLRLQFGFHRHLVGVLNTQI